MRVESRRRFGRAVLAIALGIASVGVSHAAKCDLKKDVTVEQGRRGLCDFDPRSRTFRGTPAEQASCLTREVRRGALIGSKTITPFLASLVGGQVPKAAQLQAYLDMKGLESSQLGGSVKTAITANYFVIHDTSTPNCSADNAPHSSCPVRGEFPANRDEANWRFNVTFGGHPKPYPDRLAHAFTNRVGGSITEVDFSKHMPTTKFETCSDQKSKVGLFVGVENIQPRIGEPPIPKPNKKANDLRAPDPGFTPSQYERMALLYVTASVRRGHWIIPAFHAVIDGRYRDGHDDPQNFEMTAFSAAVEKHVQGIKGK